MVNPRERLGLLVKWIRAAFTSTEEDSTEEPETETTEALEVNTETEPTMVYWEKDRNQHFIDLFLRKGGLNRIPDTTEEPVKESHFNFDNFYSNRLPEAAQNTRAANIFHINGNVFTAILLKLNVNCCLERRHTDSFRTECMTLL